MRPAEHSLPLSKALNGSRLKDQLTRSLSLLAQPANRHLLASGLRGVERETLRVTPQGKLALNHVELGFVLHEHDGVWMQCQRAGDAGYADVGSDTASPWTDTRPVKVPGTPEWRDYRACWWDNSTPSMQFGPVLRVIVNG